MLFALIILLSQALAIQANFLSANKPGDDIEALCARKSIDLTTFEQLKSLGQAAHSSSCTDTIKEALVALVWIVESGKEDLCSVESIENLQSFYSHYLDTSDNESKRDEKLPKSLRRFVIAYGLQTSNFCKQNMIQVLSKRGRLLLSKEDFEQVEELTNDSGPIAQMLSSFIGPDDFLTPGDLALFFKGSQRGGPKDKIPSASDKLFIQSTTGPYIRKLQAVCARRFRPIYEPLMMPISRLANRGFNYKDEALSESLERVYVVREVGQWARIVFLCESLGSIHIVEDSADRDAAQGTGGNLVRIVTEAEAAAIEEHKVKSTESNDDLKMAVYLPERKVLLGNEIYDKKNKELAAAVKSFKTSKSEEEIFKKKLLKKGVSMIKQEMKKGHFRFLLSTGYKGLMQHFKGKDQVSSPSQELLKVLNDMELNKVEHTDGAVSTLEDVEATLFGAIFAIIVLGAMVWLIYLCISSLIVTIG